MKRARNLFLVFLCSILYFSLAVGSSSSVTTSSDANGTLSQVSELSKYKLNEDIYITNSSGKYRLRFTKVSETKDRNMFSETKADRVIVIEYEYENLTQESDLYVSDMDFKAYDKENNKLETYPVDTKYGGRISQGRKATSSVAYALNSDSNYIEIEYYDNMFYSKPNCKIIFEW